MSMMSKMPHSTFPFLFLLLAVAGCNARSSDAVSASTASFRRLSESDRFLAACALASWSADRGPGAIPVAEWLPVYLDETSPRISDLLESALESALGGPVVARLVLETRTGTALSEGAASRLLADNRKAVRLCGVSALAECRSESAAGLLESLFLSDGEDLAVRLAAAEGLVACGRAEILSGWCTARGLSEREVPVTFAESDRDPLARGVLSALGAGGNGKGRRGEAW